MLIDYFSVIPSWVFYFLHSFAHDVANPYFSVMEQMSSNNQIFSLGWVNDQSYISGYDFLLLA